MKKKPVTTLVLLVSLVIGADMTLGKNLKAGDKIKGQTFTITEFGTPGRPWKPPVNLTNAHAKGLIEFKRGNGKWVGYDHTAEFVRMFNQLGFFMLVPGDEIIIKGSSIGCLIDVWTGNGSGRYAVDSNDRIAIVDIGKDRYLQCVSGELYESKNARIDGLMIFVSSVDDGKIKKWVDGLKKNGQSKEDLAKVIIDRKKTKAGFLSAAVGLSGPFAVPAGMAEVFCQWIIHAEIAYAIAYVYGCQPNPEEFLVDCYVLFGDDSMAKSAIKTATKTTPKEVTKTAVKAAGGQTAEKLVPALAGALAGKLAKKIAGGAMQTWNVASSVIGTVSTYKDAEKFGKRAINYYSK